MLQVPEKLNFRIIKLVISLMICFSVQLTFAKEDKCLNHPLIDHLEKNSKHLLVHAQKHAPMIYHGQRLDIMAWDIYDQVNESLSKKKFSQLRPVFREFLDRPTLKALLELRKQYNKSTDLKFAKWKTYLEENCHLISHDIFGRAIPFHATIGSENRKGKSKLNKKIQFYNLYATRPLGFWFLPHMQNKVYGQQRPATPTSLISFQKKYLNQLYNELVYDQVDTLNKHHKILSWGRFTKKQKNIHLSKKGVITKKIKDDVIPFINAIYRSRLLPQMINFWEQELLGTNIRIPFDNNMPVLTPEFVLVNWHILEELAREFTFKYLVLTNEDDRQLQFLRRWVKQNLELIEKKSEEYNQKNPQTPIHLEFTNFLGLPKRKDIIKNYPDLERLFPNLPWVDDRQTTLVTNIGAPVSFKKKKSSRIFHTAWFTTTKIINLRLLSSVSTAFLITNLSGSPFIGALSGSIVKNSFDTLFYNRKFKKFLKNLGTDSISDLVLIAPWSSGHLLKIFSVGVMEGTVQGLTTGQNIISSAAVGGLSNVIITYTGLNLVSSNPNLNAKTILTNMGLEVAENTAQKAGQGYLVAILSHEVGSEGARKGAIYGASEAALKIAFFGVRYDPEAYHEARGTDLERKLEIESNFQNKVSPLGHYDITLKEVTRIDWRVGGLTLLLNNGRPFTGPGFITTAKNDTSVHTFTHESSHLEQQDMVGLYSFYYQYFYTAKTHTTLGPTRGGSNEFEHYRGDYWQEVHRANDIPVHKREIGANDTVYLPRVLLNVFFPILSMPKQPESGLFSDHLFI